MCQIPGGLIWTAAPILTALAIRASISRWHTQGGISVRMQRRRRVPERAMLCHMQCYADRTAGAARCAVRSVGYATTSFVTEARLSARCTLGRPTSARVQVLSMAAVPVAAPQPGDQRACCDDLAMEAGGLCPDPRGVRQRATWQLMLGCRL